MKTLLLITYLFINSVLVYSQQASDYFYQGPVVEYTYDAIPLDSLNVPISSEMFNRRDLFIGEDEYEGKLAKIVLTKNAPIDSINTQPYLDSLLFSFDGSTGYEYFQTRPLEDFLIELDSSDIDSNFNFLDFFRSLENWYSVYRFSATVNDEYTLLTVDTLIAGFNMRFEYLGERFPNETLAVIGKGNLDCTKFLISWKESALLPPLPPIELLSTEDTVWIAPAEWIVQEIVPTNHVDLTFLGIPPFSIPGLFTGNPLVVSVEDELAIPTDIALKQNYPNPFNPSTKIEFRISDFGFVSLMVYDILGNEVATLVYSEKPAGVYEVEWNAIGIPSGAYFYQLQTKGYIETRKMILLR